MNWIKIVSVSLKLPYFFRNIPPSVPSERFENTDVASGIAEMQLSFQGVPQSVTLPHALPPVENPLTIMAQSSTFISSGTEGKNHFFLASDNSCILHSNLLLGARNFS